MAYIYLYLVSLFASTCNFVKKIELKFFFGLLLISSIVFLVAFRYASVDYFGYQRIYNELEWDLSKFSLFIYDLNALTPVESGFAFFSLLVKSVFDSFYVFVALFSIVSLAIKFTAFKRMSPYFFISILIYVSDEYLWKDMGQIRSAMASGIVLWAFYYASYRRFFTFLLLVLVASLFHSASFAALPFYFLRFFNSRLLMAITLFCSIVIAFFWGGIGLLLLDVGSGLGIDSSARLIKYADSEYVEGASLFGGTFFIRLSVAVLMIFFYKAMVRKWKINATLIPVYVYAVSVFFVFNDYAIIGSRIYDMVAMPIACIVIPTFMLLFKSSSKPIAFFSVFIYSTIWFLATFVKLEPYQNVFWNS